MIFFRRSRKVIIRSSWSLPTSTTTVHHFKLEIFINRSSNFLGIKQVAFWAKLSIYIIIRDCTRVGAFPRAFCVHNSFLTWHSLHLPFRSCTGPFISPDSNHSSRNSTFSKQHFRRAMVNMAISLRVHSLIARAAPHSRLRVHSLIARAAPHSRASAKRLDPA